MKRTIRLSWYKHDSAPDWWTFYLIPNLSARFQKWEHYNIVQFMVSWFLWSAFIEYEYYKQITKGKLEDRSHEIEFNDGLDN